MNTFKVMVCPDQTKPERECKPANQIEELINAGEIEAEDFDAIGILAALGRANSNPGAWYFVNGMCKGQLRMWLENDGWAIDFRNDEALVTTTEFYYQTTSLTQIRRYTPPEVAERIVTKEGRMALGIRTTE